MELDIKEEIIFSADGVFFLFTIVSPVREGFFNARERFGDAGWGISQ